MGAIAKVAVVPPLERRVRLVECCGADKSVRAVKEVAIAGRDEEPLEVPAALGSIGSFAGQAAHISVGKSAVRAAGVHHVAIAARR
jgi:hypothetical protein